MDPSSEMQESANFCTGEIDTHFFCSPEFIYSNLSEAVIIFVSGVKRRRETGMICALVKARALLALFLWVLCAPAEGGRLSAGSRHVSPFLPRNMRALKCTFAF